MPDQEHNEPISLSRMPCIVVLVTLGVLSTIHLGTFFSDGSLWDWEDGALDRAFLEAGARHVHDPVQLLRARAGFDANDVVERTHELYYQPDIDHLTGRNFLRPPVARSHVVLSSPPDTERTWDPLPAILDFHQQLAARGIRLVVLPVPSKAVFADPSRKPILNEGYREFLDRLRASGAEIHDLVPLYEEMRAAGKRLFLEGDSHWTPEAMARAARAVAATTSVQPPDDPYPVLERQLTASGDLAQLLGRPWKETVRQRMLLSRNDLRWKPDPEAPYLLLGDSFSNIYSLDAMGWGIAAGFAEALSIELRAPVDRISRNADGAFASREELLRNPQRLANKSVVVWQFAMRELSFGDWKVLPLSSPEPSSASRLSDMPEELEGTIARVAPIPSLTRTPYRQAIREVLLENVRSSSGLVPDRVVLLGYAVQNHLPTGMAQWDPGDQVRLRVISWESVEPSKARLHRFALPDDELELLEVPRAWWEPPGK